MGHEATIFGCIEGATVARLQALNAEVVSGLPVDEEWPYLSGDIFALPAPWPRGTYQSQVIHFGMSLKEEPNDDDATWDAWLGKLGAVLRRLYWFSASAVISGEFGPTRVYRWWPSKAAVDAMLSDDPQPVSEWTRTVCGLTDEAA